MNFRILSIFFSCLPFLFETLTAQPFFLENEGQVKFMNGQPDKEVIFTLSDGNNAVHFRKDGWDSYQYKPLDSVQTLATKLSCRFLNTSPLASPEAGERQEYAEHFYQGNMESGGIHAHSVNEFWIRNIYPGIDYHVQLHNGKLKYEFEIMSGAEASQIQWKYFGEYESQLQASGDIALKTELGEIHEEAPIIFRKDNGASIKGNFKQAPAGIWSYQLVDGDKTDYARVIDPLLLWTTFNGGSGQDPQFDLEELPDGSLFVSGYTTSPNNIALNGYRDTINGTADMFVARFDKSGRKIWGSYYGGGGADYGGYLLFEGSKQFYLFGLSLSSDLATRGSKQMYSASDYDIAILKIDSSGVPFWATTVGGDSSDRPHRMVFSLDSQHIYLRGVTHSSIGQVNTRGIGKLTDPLDWESFLLKMDTSGGVTWSQIVGGNGPSDDIRTDMEMLPSGNIVTLHSDLSSNLGTSNSFRQFPNGSVASAGNHRLVKYDSSGAVKWSGYLGGPQNEKDGGFVYDKKGMIYVVGTTTSTSGIIYNPGPRQSSYGGTEDIYLAKIDTNGKMMWSEYIGSSDKEGGYLLRMKNDTTLYMAGTAGKGIFFGGGFQDTANSIKDCFILSLDTAGRKNWGTYFGGNDYEYPFGMSLGDNYILMAGYTGSSSFFGSYRSYQNTFGGNQVDGYLLKIVEDRILCSFTPAAQYCAGDTIHIPVFIEDSLLASNNIRIELSDLSGSFANPSVLLQKSKTDAGYDTLVVPLSVTTWPSAQYKIRMLLTAPKDTFFFDQVFEVKGAPNRLYSNTFKTGLCAGDTVSVVSNNPAGFHYEWFRNGIFTGDTLKNIRVASPGNYHSQITGTNGCMATSSPLAFTAGIYPEAAIHANDSQFCENLVDLSLRDSSKKSIGKRVWFLDGIQMDTAANVLIQQMSPGLHTFRLKVQSQDLCWDSSSLAIQIDAAPVAQIMSSDTQSCENMQEFLFHLPASHSYTFHEFSLGDSSSSMSDSVVHSYQKFGNYEVRLVVQNAVGCADTAYRSVTVFPIPTADFIFVGSPYCTNVPPVRLGNRSLQFTSSKWLFGDGDSSAQTHPTHIYGAGNYMLTLIAGNTDKCYDTIQKSLDVFAPETATITISSNMICPNDSIQFSSNCAAQVSQRWFLNTQLLDTTCALWVNDSAQYTLIRKDGNGCSDTAFAKIGVYPPVQAPSIVQDWDTLKVNPAYAVYRWFHNGQLLNAQVSRSMLASQNGNYEVEVEDGNGCMARSAVFILNNVGIPDNTGSGGITVYPNPTKGGVYLSGTPLSGKNVSIRVYNNLGMLCLEEDGNGTSEIHLDLSAFPASVYTIRIQEAASILGSVMVVVE